MKELLIYIFLSFFTFIMGALLYSAAIDKKLEEKGHCKLITGTVIEEYKGVKY